jgi:MFS family permease
MRRQQERGEPILFWGWIVSGYWVGLTLGRLLLGKVAQRIGNRRLIEACLSGVVVGMLLVWGCLSWQWRPLPCF